MTMYTGGYFFLGHSVYVLRRFKCHLHNTPTHVRHSLCCKLAISRVGCVPMYDVQHNEFVTQVIIRWRTAQFANAALQSRHALTSNVLECPWEQHSNKSFVFRYIIAHTLRFGAYTRPYCQDRLRLECKLKLTTYQTLRIQWQSTCTYLYLYLYL